jgi:Fe(3+) dicitrate transport protein
MNKRILYPLIVGAWSATGAIVGAQEADEPVQLEAISIIGDDQDVFTKPGSAHVISKEELETFEYTDIHRVLQSVPGVYVREEDGYGLRPNIGIRGATSERSSKVTLLEDGILLAPAPYAAPAAYYFPVVTRMTSVEVYKGPVSIKHGPYTVGGAINLITRPIPSDSSGGIDAALGTDDFRKLHGYYGDSSENFGALIEGIHLESDGFKELDGGGDTGFDRNDTMLKLRANSDPDAATYHQFDLKLGYADEASNETYLGLTDADFEDNPYRRYAASQLDRFEHDRQQYELSYYLAPSANYDLTTTVYRHDFERVWGKLNGFGDPGEVEEPTLNDILANPGTSFNSIFVDVLRGERDSLSPAETLVIGTNDREYYSQGVQAVAHWWPMIGNTEHEVEIGLRYHEDEVERLHTENGFLMSGGNLVSDGRETAVTADETGSAEAIAMYVHDEFTLGKFTLSSGVRTELIDTKLVDRIEGTTTTDSTDVLIPGAGIFYEVTPSLGLLAGVHKGFVSNAPRGPNQPDADPEESINYEAGFRFLEDKARAEIIGFFSDYSNLVARCTFSAGCDEDETDQEFNSGEVDILGVEALIGYEFTAAGLRFPASLSYTYTDAEFQDSFDSQFPQFGKVQEGDKLPYVPPHQATLRLGVHHDSWQADVSATYVDEMRDEASQGEPLADPDDEEFFLVTDEQFTVDLTGSYNLTKNGQVYLQVTNFFDSADIVSYRPFGARPGNPRLITVGYEHRF